MSIILIIPAVKRLLFVTIFPIVMIFPVVTIFSVVTIFPILIMIQ